MVATMAAARLTGSKWITGSVQGVHSALVRGGSALFGKRASALKTEEGSPRIRRQDVLYSGSSLLQEAFKSKAKDFFKLGNYGSFWTNRALSSPSVVLDLFGKDMGHAKNCFGVFEVVKKSPELGSAVLQLASAPSATSACSLLLKSSDWFNSCTDVVSAVNRYVPISCMRTIGNVNAGATLLFAGSKVKENGTKLVNAETNQAKLLHLINLVGALTYAIFGVLTLGALAMGSVVPAVTVISLLTLGTVLSLTGFFYEKVWDPECKNENVDFAKVKPQLRLA